MADSVRIDAHHHLWELGRFSYEWLNAAPLAPIRRNYLPDDLQPLLKAAKIDYSVFVQTQHNEAETAWVLGLAEQYPSLAGVVGWVDLASPTLEASIERFKENPKFVGVRHVVQDEPDDDFIVRADVLRGLKVLERHQVPFDLLFYVKHLRHVPRIASLCPNLPLVIDHLAKPCIRSGIRQPWADDLRQAAQFPQVFCKISGLVTEADWGAWSIGDLRPYVMFALETFGANRCMFGSDWPVCELAAPYSRVVDAVSEITDPLTSAEKSAIFGRTALNFYRLPLSP